MLKFFIMLINIRGKNREHKSIQGDAEKLCNNNTLTYNYNKIF